MSTQKVLIVSNNFSPNVGGIETHLDDLVKEISLLGIGVVVLTHKPLQTKAKAKLLERDGQVTIIRLPWFRNLFYKTLGHPALAFLYLTPALFFAMPFVMLSRRFDVVHAHSMSSAFACAAWSPIFRTRFVVTLHAKYAMPSGGGFYKMAKFILARAAVVFCLSDEAISDIKQLELPNVAIEKFTNWVDLDKFKPLPQAQARRLLALPSGDFIALFAGRLVAEKGVLDLLQAARSLDPRILVVIAGDGPLAQTIEQAEATEPVRFVGKIENSRLPQYLSAADIFINPPTHVETFARVNLEALACGKPIIGPNRGEVTEILDDNVSVQIEINPSSIAAAINELAANPTGVKKLAKNARHFVEEHYSRRHAAKILEAYALKAR